MKLLLSKIVRGIRFSIRNLDSLAAIALGISALLLGTLSDEDSTKKVLAITSGTLAVIAFGMLRDRESAEKLNISLDGLSRQPDEISFGGRNRLELELAETFDRARQEVWILLRTGRVIRDYYELRSATERNCKVRIVLCTPDPSVAKMLAMRTFSEHTEEQEQNAVQDSLSELLDIVGKLPRGSNIEIRVIAYVPSYVLFMSDAETDRGYACAQIVSFKVSREKTPYLKTSIQENANLFEFFKQDFKNYWNAAKPVS
jgi:hypothetical protein